ncbi:hypothetical protein SAMN05421811_127135 [Nonomuraea wenchangensis]|uniref:Uncharacterized protein n=1 Tax=Nonomuraea wenchangensis TaxID=568860 RepID=A0A1I0LWL3_9ACTN|nr:hypothetical protein SAMN05421811_127135 [Nonomuraea wenchangensis]
MSGSRPGRDATVIYKHTMRYERQDVLDAVRALAASRGSLSRAVEELLASALGLGDQRPDDEQQQLTLGQSTPHDRMVAA